MEVITPTVSQANIAPGETPLPRSTPPDARSIHSTRPREDGAPSPNKENEDGDKPKPLTGFKLWILFGAVIFATFLMALNGAILATAIPKITTELKSLDDIGWYGSAYLLSICSLQPLVGKFYTHFPIKTTYIVFIVIFSLGSVLCATATSSNMLIGGRAVQGIGGAGLLNGAFITIAAAAPKELKPLFVGVGIGTSTVGSVIGPLIGGALTENVSWRWCFYINLPPSAIVLGTFLYVTIPEQIKKQPVRANLKNIIVNELDLMGFALFAPACIMFLLALNWGGNQYRWNSATILGLFCGAFATAVVFGVWEFRRGERAMIPLNVIRTRLVFFGCCTSCFQCGSMFLLSFYLPLWFQVVKDATPLMSGVMILPTAISQAVGSIVAGKFVQVIGTHGDLSLSTGAGPWIGYQILVGLGRAPVLQMPITAIQSLLPAKDVAIACSQVFLFQYLGGSVFVAIGQTIFTNDLQASLRHYAPTVNAQEVIEAGASAVRSTVSDVDLHGVLLAYNHAIIATFYLAIGGSCAAFLASFGMGWQKLPGKEGKKKIEDEKA